MPEPAASMERGWTSKLAYFSGSRTSRRT